MVALQAQQPASPYVALWNRLTAFDPAGLDTAFTDHRVVKATLMRLTLHAVHADDHPAFREAMHPVVRASRLGDRFTVSGLTAEDADALVPRLLEFADRPRTTAECEAWLGDQLGRRRWRGVVGAAAVHTAAPRTHLAAVVVRSPALVHRAADRSRTDGSGGVGRLLRALVLRYLSGFGPASVADVAQFAMVTRSRARAALAALAGGLERLEGRRARSCSICRGLLGRTGRSRHRPG